MHLASPNGEAHTEIPTPERLVVETSWRGCDTTTATLEIAPIR
jgi:hypothetical protein